MAGSSELHAGAPMQVELADAEVDIHGVLAMLDSDDLLAQDPALSPDALGSCWGVYLKGSGVGCTPGFRQGKGHFKNKFCSRCQTQPLPVPLDRVRALDPAQASTSNRRSEGFWNESDEGCFRVVNNTAACIEPPIAIYREAAPVEARAEWRSVPEQWIEEGCVKFCVAKGTLVPVASLRGGHLYSSQQQKRQRTAATAEARAGPAARAPPTAARPPPAAAVRGPNHALRGARAGGGGGSGGGPQRV